MRVTTQISINKTAMSECCRRDGAVGHLTQGARGVQVGQLSAKALWWKGARGVLGLERRGAFMAGGELAR